MLAFDLPDYSKSSTAQNEKLARERNRDWRKEEEAGGRRRDPAGARYPSRLPEAKPKFFPPRLVLPGDLVWL